jgi:hypothetical protein
MVVDLLRQLGDALQHPDGGDAVPENLLGKCPSWIAKAAEPGADRVPDDFAPRVQALDAGPAYEYARRGLEP